MLEKLRQLIEPVESIDVGVGDMIELGVHLPAVTPGDWLVIENAGANTYGLWSRHCSRALPRSFGIDQGQVEAWDRRRPVFS